MIHKLPICLSLSLALLLVASSQAQAQIAYTFNNNGLFRFDLATPGTLTAIGPFTGAATSIDGLDFRPANGLLYGYDAALNQVVQINVTNAVTTFVATPSTASNVDTLGLDFNPAADRLRLVNADDQNLRINLAGGATLVDGGLAYAAGDTNQAANPNIDEAAYLNNDQDPGTGTTLYYIDSLLDILATTSNPNGGVLNTVGALGVNTNPGTGFDIFTSGGNNLAYAILDPGLRGAAPGLYSIDLGTGQATLIGALDSVTNVLDGTAVFGLAITPVPEPGSLALLAMGLIGVVAFRRRKR